MPISQKNRIKVDPLSNSDMVVSFTDNAITDVQQVDDIGEQLMALADAEKTGQRRIVLDFGGVADCDSSVFGKLRMFEQKLQARGDKLLVANMDIPVLKIFEMARLHTVFDCYPEMAANEALASHQKKMGRASA